MGASWPQFVPSAPGPGAGLPQKRDSYTPMGCPRAIPALPMGDVPAPVCLPLAPHTPRVSLELLSSRTWCLGSLLPRGSVLVELLGFPLPYSPCPAPPKGQRDPRVRDHQGCSLPHHPGHHHRTPHRGTPRHQPQPPGPNGSDGSRCSPPARTGRDGLLGSPYWWPLVVYWGESQDPTRTACGGYWEGSGGALGWPGARPAPRHPGDTG